MTQSSSFNEKYQKRKPVRSGSESSQSKLSPTQSQPTMRTMALDPGLALTGVAVVRWERGAPQVETAALLVTKKAKKKDLQEIRVSTDDQRRMRDIWDQVRQIMHQVELSAVAIEGYSPIPGRQGGGAWKVGAVTQMLMALCWAEKCEPVIVRPTDLRKRFLRNTSGSKLDIEQAVSDEVSGAARFLETFPKSRREHLADAIGYAVVAYDEMMRIRRVAGL